MRPRVSGRSATPARAAPMVLPSDGSWLSNSARAFSTLDQPEADMWCRSDSAAASVAEASASSGATCWIAARSMLPFASRSFAGVSTDAASTRRGMAPLEIRSMIVVSERADVSREPRNGTLSPTRQIGLSTYDCAAVAWLRSEPIVSRAAARSPLAISLCRRSTSPRTSCNCDLACNAFQASHAPASTSSTSSPAPPITIRRLPRRRRRRLTRTRPLESAQAGPANGSG